MIKSTFCGILIFLRLKILSIFALLPTITFWFFLGFIFFSSLLAISANSFESSIPIPFLWVFSQAIKVEPTPKKGSSTYAFFFVNKLINF